MAALRKFISLALVFVLLTTLIPLGRAESLSEYLSLEEAAAVVRREMTARASVIPVNFWLEADHPGLETGSFLDVLTEAAFEHTGVGREGDYLRLSFGGGSANYDAQPQGDRIYYTIIFYPLYHTSALEEAWVEMAIDWVLEELNLDGLSDFEKALRIYQFIEQSVEYETENSFFNGYTAFEALCEGTAVCQGYASLLYRMLLEVGIDCRCITGLAAGPHAWNIIGLDGLYYYADATKDSSASNKALYYFLKGASFEEGLTPEIPFTTPEFLERYPISPEDYPLDTARRHEFKKTFTEASCTEGAYYTLTCRWCDQEVIHRTDPALGHDLGDWYLREPPMCGYTYRETRECSRCNYHEYRDCGIWEHTWETTVVEPTCTELGCTQYKCSHCGTLREDTITPSLPHQPDEGRVLIPATEDSSGEIAYTCTLCGQEWTEVLPPIGHVHHYEVYSNGPFCDLFGQIDYVCDCGYRYTETVPATGHSYVTQTHGPTCTEEGFTLGVCSVCGEETVTDLIPRLGHDWDEGEITLQPTCTQEGELLHRCSRCDETMITVLPKEAHIYDADAQVTESTCLLGGYTIYSCACGARMLDAITEPLGHDFGEWVELIPVTCAWDGSAIHICARCFAGERAYAEMGPHLYLDGFCVVCGEAESGNPFTDVEPAQWYFEPVLWAVENGITSGTSATTFAPNQTCTRAQVVTFLWRAMGSPEPESSENPFSDVMETDYFYSAVLWAVEKGITSGTGNGQFSPNRPCTRDQVVTFLWRTMGEPDPEKIENPFTDVAEGIYYYQPVLWAVENNITSGTSATTFAPSNPCTRAQVVTFLFRALKDK
ncbi:MAG: S-layer homology domain-containing protein [Oscillospiraceae bacterium]|nr:S-layer homology domain-containing protein [Oscillospiraceae bacterium]